MPIGSGATYLKLYLTPPAQGYATDEDYLAFDPSSPSRRLIERNFWWPYPAGTKISGTDTGLRVKVPDSWIVTRPVGRELPNRGSAALQSDGRAREFQYTVRPSSGSNISFYDRPRAVLDLAGDGLTWQNNVGGHGGSGMTAIGGTIRAGELSGSAPIKHALAVTMNMRKWGTKQGGKITDGYRWPAIAADLEHSQTGYATGYGTLGGTSRDGLGMGSLLAIPASVDINALGLETEIGRKLAWTHQNYGAYVVDNSGDYGGYDVHRFNIDGAALAELPSIEKTNPGSNYPAYRRDMDKIFRVLAVVDNNSPTSIGGGGTPRQPLLPPIGN